MQNKAFCLDRVTVQQGEKEERLGAAFTCVPNLSFFSTANKRCGTLRKQRIRLHKGALQ
jgi:hypothetical protein